MNNTVQFEDVVFGKAVTSDGKAVPIDIAGKTLGELSSDDLVAVIYQAKEVVQVGVVGVDYPAPLVVPIVPIREIHLEEEEEE